TPLATTSRSATATPKGPERTLNRSLTVAAASPESTRASCGSIRARPADDPGMVPSLTTQAKTPGSADFATSAAISWQGSQSPKKNRTTSSERRPGKCGASAPTASPSAGAAPLTATRSWRIDNSRRTTSSPRPSSSNQTEQRTNNAVLPMTPQSPVEPDAERLEHGQRGQQQIRAGDDRAGEQPGHALIHGGNRRRRREEGRDADQDEVPRHRHPRCRLARTEAGALHALPGE